MSLRSLNDEERRILRSGLDGAFIFVVGSILVEVWSNGATVIELLGDIWSAQLMWFFMEVGRIFAMDWYHDL